MSTEDVLLEDLSVQLLALHVVSGESLLGVGDEDSTIGGTLHGTKETVTGGSPLETDIEVGLEWSWGILVVQLLGEDKGTVGVGDTLVLVGEAELGEGTTSDKEAGGVGSGPVGETVCDAVLGKLVGTGSGENKVTLETSVDDLADDVLVGETDNETVLGGVAKVECQ